MKGILVRVGIDQSYGNWNAPMNPITNEFVYVPINEKITTDFEKGLDTSYHSFLPTLENFVSARAVCKHHKIIHSMIIW